MPCTTVTNFCNDDTQDTDAIAMNKLCEVSLTEDNVIVACKNANVWYSQGLYQFGLRVPMSCSAQTTSPGATFLKHILEEKFQRAVRYWLRVDPNPTWRRLITAVDYYAEQHEAAKTLYNFAEPISDPTLTQSNVKAVLGSVADADMLFRWLKIPLYLASDKDAAINYWICHSSTASWVFLAGALLSLGEGQALSVVKQRFAPEANPYLTLKDLCQTLSGVEHWWTVAEWMSVPKVKLRNIVLKQGDSPDASRQAWEVWLAEHPEPSWSVVAEALYKSWEHNVLKKLESIYPFVIGPARKINACHLAMKEKGFVDEIIVQGALSGFPRAGKTSLKNRLVGQYCIPPSSTGVADKATRVEISKSIVHGNVDWIEYTSIQKETALVAQKIALHYNCDISKLKQDIELLHHPDKSVTLDEYDRIVQNVSSQSEAMRQETCVITSSALTPLKAIKSSVLSTHKKIQDSGHHSSSVWTQYLTDVGGQLEFQELFPLLFLGPALFYYVFRADHDILAPFSVNYLHSSGKQMTPLKATMTTKDAILQFLSSVSSLGFTKLSNGVKVQAKVFFVATHIDQLPTISDIENLDQKLQGIVKTTDAHRSGCIVFKSDDSMVFPVNNLTRDEDQFQAIRRSVHGCITCNKHYQIRMPTTWSIFALTIQHYDKPVLAYDTCLELAMQCGLEDAEELDNCLWFLHFQTGILRHYRDIPELRVKVIKDPQYIFDTVTEIIVTTFTFDNLAGNKCIQDEFMNKGIFSQETLVELLSDRGFLSAAEIIRLLEHHLIIAPINKGDKKVKYFLPSALVHLDQHHEEESFPDWLPSLYFTFNSGYCPSGLFGALVARLLGMNSNLPYEWKLQEDRIYRNQIFFSVGPYLDQLRLVVTPADICVSVIPFMNFERHVPLASICNHVQEHLSKLLQEVIKRINYDSQKVLYHSSFQCMQCANEDFDTAGVKFDNELPCVMECSATHQPIKLPSGYRYWFDKKHTPTKHSSVAQWKVDEIPDIPLTMSRLTLMKWIDEFGEPHYFRFLEEVCGRWMELGDLLEISASQLMGLQVQYMNSNRLCCRDIFCSWLNGKCTDRYAVSWNGLLTLLQDADDSMTYKDLIMALHHSR